MSYRARAESRKFVLLSDLRVSDEPLVGIVTALPVEYASMKHLISGCKSSAIPGDPSRYVRGFIPQPTTMGFAEDTSKRRRLSVVLTRLKRMGTNSAAAAATNLLRSFPSVRVVIMTGIACAVPNPTRRDRNVKLGDIVVSDRKGVVQFDNFALTDGEVTPRDVTPPPSAALVDALNELESAQLNGQEPWNGYIAHIINRARAFAQPQSRRSSSKRTAAKRPHVFRGLIGSSNILLKDKAFRDALRDRYGLLAIEMEGSGIAEATWGFDKYYFLVRGMCDFGDNKKKDRWQGYAAAAAASYTRALLDVLLVT